LPRSQRVDELSEKARVEIFSDAVFAVAITLLVLDLRIPDSSAPLIDAMADRWAYFAAFAISFVTVGCIWINHFRVLRSLDSVDPVLIVLNLALLMTVVLIPFSTSLMAAHVIASGAQSHVAAAIFSSTMALMGLAFTALYLRARRHQPAGESAGAAQRSWRATLQFAAGIFVNAAGVGLAFVSALVVLILFAMVCVYYLVDELVLTDFVRDRSSGRGQPFSDSPRMSPAPRTEA
jgi:uncharacterized membrane protein